MLGTGCELLVLVYGSGPVGSLVLPILGALPDAVMILVSGLGTGTKEEVEAGLSVGVGMIDFGGVLLFNWVRATR